MEDERPRQRPTGVTFHLTPEAVWDSYADQPQYLPESFDAEGFVHCTDGEPFVLEVANRFYRNDPRPFVLLDVELGRAAARAVYEDPERRYPHLYGPIEREAIIRVRRIERSSDGSFTSIGREIESGGA